MNVLDQTFLGSYVFGDERRVSPQSKLLADFLQVPMASGVAAQFLVSDFSVYRRPKAFWEKLYHMNNGSILIPHCNSRSYKEGTEVASAMERIWHNFFRDMSAKDSHRPKKCLDQIQFRNRTAFPLYMEDFPVCCLHQLPQYVVTATASDDPNSRGTSVSSTGCNSVVSASSSISNDKLDKKRSSANSNFRQSRFTGNRRPS